ncbi:MAG: hypothetical protein P4L41_00775 [Flavipsychrobacter sp.]|nr:hypothetical protein [Flavipsychrobacter sp.]
MRSLLTFLALVVLSTNAFGQAPTLVGSWQFNGNANDGSGNGLNGTVYNATLTAGQSGGANTAYKFNGATSFISVPYSALLDITKFTIQATVRIDSFNPNTCQAEFIVNRGTQATTHWYNMGINDNAYDNSCSIYSPNNTEFVDGVSGTSTASLHAGNYIQAGTWYCHTYTYDGTKMRLYLNGTIIDSVAIANVLNYSGSHDSLVFGYYPAGGVSFPYWLNGAIDNISIWNGVLSDSVIANICNVEDSCSLQCYWRVGGNSSITSSDFLGTTNAEPVVIKTNNIQRAVIQGSGNGNMGIATATPTTTLHLNAVAPKGVPSGLRLEQLPAGTGNILVIDSAGYVYKAKSQTALAETRDNELANMQDKITQMQQQINTLQASMAASITKNGSSLSLSPNPTSGQVTAVYTISGSVSNAEISITDNMGKTILMQPVTGNSGSIILDIPGNVVSNQLLCTLFADGRVVASQKLALLNK